MKQTYSKDDLIDLAPQHDLLVAIDSDGCVFDSMSIKQRILHTEIINFWGLHEAEADVRKIAEWVSLFSPWRGLNRFQLILKIFQSLGNCVAAQDQSGFRTGEENVPSIGNVKPSATQLLPKGEKRRLIEALEMFVNSGVPLSMVELEKRPEPELKKVLEWSTEVSRQIAVIGEMPVFDEVFQGLEKLREASDLIVVSQTTEDALVREWRHAELEEFVDVIAGAELGSKAESLIRAAVGRYSLQKIVMVGDAPGDLEAAQAVGCLFFPILPGEEPASWVELRTTALDHLHAGTFAGAYQDELIARFNEALSPVPPWAG